MPSRTVPCVNLLGVTFFLHLLTLSLRAFSGTSYTLPLTLIFSPLFRCDYLRSLDCRHRLSALHAAHTHTKNSTTLSMCSTYFRHLQKSQHKLRSSWRGAPRAAAVVQRRRVPTHHRGEWHDEVG